MERKVLWRKPPQRRRKDEDELAYDVTWYDPMEHRRRLFPTEEADAQRDGPLASLQKQYKFLSATPSEEDELATLGKYLCGFFTWFTLGSRRQYCLSVSEGALVPMTHARDDGPLKAYSTHRPAEHPLIPPMPEGARRMGKDRLVPAPGVYVDEVFPKGGCEVDIMLDDMMCFFNALLPAKFATAQVIVQDPFILDRNTAQNVGPEVAQRWDQEIRRAADLLQGASPSKKSKSGEENRELDPCLPNIASLIAPVELLAAAIRA